MQTTISSSWYTFDGVSHGLANWLLSNGNIFTYCFLQWHIIIWKPALLIGPFSSGWILSDCAPFSLQSNTVMCNFTASADKSKLEERRGSIVLLKNPKHSLPACTFACIPFIFPLFKKALFTFISIFACIYISVILHSKQWDFHQ